MANRMTVVNKAFTVMTDNALTSIDRMVLSQLYAPLVGGLAISVFECLHNQMLVSEFESNILSHQAIFSALNINATTFVKERTKLEGIGLVKTYYKDDLYIYVLNNVLSPYEFFKNEHLMWLLEINLDKNRIEKLKIEFLLRKLDVNLFEDITTSFDEAFDVREAPTTKVDYGVNTTNNGLEIANEYFDLDAFLIMMQALEYIKPEIYNSTRFLDLMNRLAFFYKLDLHDLKSLVLICSTEAKEIDYSKLEVCAKRKYEEKNLKNKVVVREEIVEEDDKVANVFNQISPNEIFESQTGCGLTSSQIELFNKLLLESGVTIGVLNVCINYLIIEKGKKVMPYNFYLTVLNDWKRQGIKSAKQALDYINNKPTEQKTNARDYKKVKKTPEWYKNYKDSKESNKEKKEFNESSDLDDITKFFDPES